MPNPAVDKGKRAELALAAYLRTWYPGAERSVATGFKAKTRASADRGDIRDAYVPEFPIAWQCKDLADPLVGLALGKVLRETRTQRDAAGARLGVLVEKVNRKASAGDWYAWVDARELAALDMRRWSDGRAQPAGESGRPVRLHLGHLMTILEHAGYAPAITDGATA